MSQTSETSFNKSDTDEVRQQLRGKHVCPFCGVIRGDQSAPCPRCTMEDTLATRQGTRQRIGPWYVMQARNPSAPGMKFATLVSLVKKGHVTPRSIVRGPTTHQLWTFAAKVRGLSRELGLCHHCGDAVDASAASCGSCGRQQEPPSDPDVLVENQSGLPELSLSTQVNPETSLDAAATNHNETTAQGLSRSTRPATPSISAPPSNVRPAQPPLNNNLSRSEESILSARELAAAFQLDFKPKKPAPANRSAPVAAAPAPVQQPAPVPTPILEQPRSGSGKWVVLFLFLLLAAAVTLIFVKPEWQQKIAALWETAKSSINKPAAPNTILPPEKTTRVEKTDKPEIKPFKVAQPPIIRMTTQPAIVEESVETPVVEKPVEVKKEEPKPAPAPAPVAKVEEKKPAEDNYDDSKLTLDQATALAKQLRNEAIDLEDAGRWNEALFIYQRMDKLPADAHPGDLSWKLQRAKSKVK